MSKQLMTLAIVLSLGTAGCAGFALQQGSSLTQVQTERGLDNLWDPPQEAPTQGLEAPRYAGQGFGNLWNSAPDASPVVDSGFYSKRTGGDLWNPASVTRSWEVEEREQVQPSRGLSFSDSSRRNRAGRSRVAAQ